MQHNLREFLRHGGSGQYVFARQNGAVYGYRAGISIKSVFPGYAELRADFTDQLDRVIADNARMLLNALTRGHRALGDRSRPSRRFGCEGGSAAPVGCALDGHFRRI
jgi:hypothetical protein